MKITRNKIIAAVAVVCVLAVAFIWGGNYVSDSRPSDALTATASASPTAEASSTPEASVSASPAATPQTSASPTVQPSVQPAAATVLATAKPDAKDSGTQPPAPTAAPSGQVSQPDEPAPPAVTLSISCQTLLAHMDGLSEEKRGLVPQGGVILPATQVEITPGESVFDALRRATRDNKIHLEFSNTPAYKSAYIEGIANLYEFDCGELSGWMYKVDGTFPGYGSSSYALQGGERIEWVYTTNLGRDVGGNVQGWQR